MKTTIGQRIASKRKSIGLTQEELAIKMNVSRSLIGQIENSLSNPNLEFLHEFVRIANTSYAYLIDGDEKDKKDAHPNAHLNAHLIAGEPHTSYTKSGALIEHVVDTSGHRLVPIVDIKAAAGDGYINAEAIEESDVLRLPVTMVKSGHHLCIRIKGTSMAPTLQDGGFLVIRLLERSEWLNMPNERIYVIVTNEGKTYTKRVKNRFLGEKGFIVLNSDSPDKSSHPSFNLYPEDIQHIWYVEWYFTAKMPNIHDQYYNRVSGLEDKVDLLAEEMRQIKKQLK